MNFQDYFLNHLNNKFKAYKTEFELSNVEFITQILKKNRKLN